jgi:hypothetical protein
MTSPLTTSEYVLSDILVFSSQCKSQISNTYKNYHKDKRANCGIIIISVHKDATRKKNWPSDLDLWSMALKINKVPDSLKD